MADFDIAVIGGGPGSFIGAMHRQAARLDDRYEIVTGVLSSDIEKSKKAALEQSSLTKGF